MNHRLYLPLALLFSGCILLLAACNRQGIPTMADSGVIDLIKTDIKLGMGAEAVAGRAVSVHYTGWLYDVAAQEYKGIKFDSSRERHNPFVFTVGAGRVIKGWDEGVAGMKVGGQRRLVIPPEMAYGVVAASKLIPANATLVFDVELVGIH